MWCQGLLEHAQEWCRYSTQNVTRFEVTISREGDCLSTRTDEVFRRVLAVVSGNRIDYVVAGECGGSVKAYQVHQDKLGGAIEGHIWTVVYKVINNVRGLTVADISGRTVVSVVINVRKGEFAVKAAIGFGRERLVETRVESHPAIAPKQQGTLHCLTGDDVYPLRKRRGRLTILVNLNGPS